MGWPADVEKAKFYTNVVFPKTLESETFTSCCYCGKKISISKAVVRDDMIMCQKCAEKHPPTTNAKMEQKK